MKIIDTGSDHPARTVSVRRLWIAALIGGLIASPLTWVTGEASVNQFRAKEVAIRSRSRSTWRGSTGSSS